MAGLTIDFTQLKKEHWSDEETQNAALVVDFVKHLMNDHDFGYIRENFGSGTYKQHNRTMEDGLSGVVDYVSRFTKRFPDFTYDVKHIYVDGPFVTLHSHSTSSVKDRGNPNKGFNIIDIWKVEDGRLVEHWDAIQAINGSMRLFTLFAGGSVKNQNTLF